MPDQNDSEILLYTADDGATRIDVRMLDDTVWLSQSQMAELFGKSVKTINEHVKNIFNEGELEPAPTIRNFRIVRLEGQREVSRDIDHYNLDAIISVGYRVRSQQGTRVSGPSGPPRSTSTKKFSKSTPPAKITTRVRNRPGSSSPRSRTSSTTPLPA